VDYPTTPGNYEYRLVAISPDALGDSIVYNNINLAGLYIKR
jgi:hypothetical protein